MRDLKYLSAYLIPLATGMAISLQGFWSYSTIIFAFVIIPLFEPLMASSPDNLPEEEKQRKLSKQVFDILLYLNIPIVYGLLAFWAWSMMHHSLETYELIGMLFSVGTLIGVNGINVAHELGHRRERYERRMAKILLLPALYMHFYIEHNRGHHKYVATELDPASARLGEVLYTFWIRSIAGSYLNAWQHEGNKLEKKGLPFWSIHNEMLRFQLIQLAYLTLIGLLAGWKIMLFFIGAGLIGTLLLETINYIEHYGLRRKKLPSGRYERVLPQHSWNADFEFGRIVLYELTRHSDHHYIASKKYQVLDHHDESPQLPVGYPTSMLMALVPPLWFRVMNPRVEARKRTWKDLLEPGE